MMMVAPERQENVFREALHDLVGINFEGLCKIVEFLSILSSSAMFLTSATFHLSYLYKPPSTVEHQSWARRRKFRRTAWYFTEFRSTLGVDWYSPAMFLTSTMYRSSDLFGRRQRESMSTAIVINRRSPVVTAYMSHHFACTFRHPFSVNSFCFLHNTHKRCQTQKATNKQKSTPTTLGNWDEPCLCLGKKAMW